MFHFLHFFLHFLLDSHDMLWFTLKLVQYIVVRRLVIDFGQSRHNTKEGKMRFQEIQMKAKGMGINPFRMKKKDLIQFIQKEENNIDCYGTDRAHHCEEHGCLLRSDCLSLNGHGKVT